MEGAFWANETDAALRRSKKLGGLVGMSWPWGPVAGGQQGPQAGAKGRSLGRTPRSAYWPHVGNMAEATLLGSTPPPGRC